MARICFGFNFVPLSVCSATGFPRIPSFVSLYFCCSLSRLNHVASLVFPEKPFKSEFDSVFGHFYARVTAGYFVRKVTKNLTLEPLTNFFSKTHLCTFFKLTLKLTKIVFVTILVKRVPGERPTSCHFQ